MIQLCDDGAVLLIGAFAVLAVGWGANLSVRSALRGPEWALRHLILMNRYLLVPLLAGVALTFLVAPAWAGLAVIYITVMVWWLAGMLRRSLLRIGGDEGFGEVPVGRRAEIVARARRWLYTGAVVLAALGVAALGPATSTGIVMLALATVLAGTGLMIRAETAG